MKHFKKLISAVCVLCMIMSFAVSVTYASSEETSAADNGQLKETQAKEGEAAPAADNTQLLAMLEQAKGTAPADTRLSVFYTAVITGPTIHYSYDYQRDYTDDFMDVSGKVEVFAKEDAFYSMTETERDGAASSNGTFINADGVFSLSPAENKAYYAIDSEGLNYRIMLGMDEFCQKLERHSEDTDFSEETREIDGITYLADVYPADEFNPEYTYCFTEEGILTYIFTGPAKAGDVDLGENTYKLNSVYSEVDESVFSMDGYVIEGAPE